jgi:hypothetical protein
MCRCTKTHLPSLQVHQGHSHMCRCTRPPSAFPASAPGSLTYAQVHQAPIHLPCKCTRITHLCEGAPGPIHLPCKRTRVTHLCEDAPGHPSTFPASAPGSLTYVQVHQAPIHLPCKCTGITHLCEGAPGPHPPSLQVHQDHSTMCRCTRPPSTFPASAPGSLAYVQVHQALPVV